MCVCMCVCVCVCVCVRERERENEEFCGEQTSRFLPTVSKIYHRILLLDISTVLLLLCCYTSSQYAEEDLRSILHRWNSHLRLAFLFLFIGWNSTLYIILSYQVIVYFKATFYFINEIIQWTFSWRFCQAPFFQHF